MRLAAAIAWLWLAAAPAAVADSPMEQCAVRWRDLGAAGQAGRDYRTFAAACLKTLVSAPPQPVESKPKRPSRMGQCAARWDEMKAQGATHGLSYRQWTSICMKKKS